MAALWCAMEAAGEGLKNQQWGESELRQIEADLAGIHPWKDWHRAISSERAMFNSIYDKFAAASPSARATMLAGLTGPPAGVAPSTQELMALIPRRVFRDNQLRQNQYVDELLAQADATGFDIRRPTPSSPDHLKGLASYYYVILRAGAESYPSLRQPFAAAQTKLHQARIAVALERHRLARGAFPDRLAELTPEWLPSVPNDPLSRQPMIYRREQTTKAFLLYGVGKNLLDDGGTISHPRKSEYSQNDLLWLHAPPAKAAAPVKNAK
jgi:hypothetical protein